MSTLRPWALVTGASGGIGAALAAEAAKDGHNLLLVARSADRLEAVGLALKSDHRVEVLILPLDLLSETAADEIEAFAKDHDVDISVLINNAGVGLRDPFVDLDHAGQMDMIRLNVAILTDLARRFLPAMVQQRTGGVLNVASTASFTPGPNMAVYFATKAYVKALSEALHREVKGSGLKVTALCPGPTRTDFFENTGSLRFTGGLFMMSPERVARIGYKKFRKGKRVCVPGVTNKVSVLFFRYMPRWAVLGLTAAITKRKKT